MGGCFFSLADLVDPMAVGGTGGIGPFGGASSVGGTGAVAMGGSGGSVVAPPCPLDNQKRCTDGDGECHPIAREFGCASTTCTPCGSVLRANVGCSELGECIIESCEPGFADCNGDVISDIGDIAGDGCEFAFQDVAQSSDVMEVPFANIVVDGNAVDWAGIPAYAYAEVCRDCEDDFTALITEDGTVPGRNDLDAYFRVAWNSDFFFVVQDAFDPDLLDDSTLVESCTERGGDEAICEDGFQVFLDGRQDGPENYFNDNIRVMVGLSERIFAPAQGQPGGNVAVKSLQWAPACYRIEARFDWRYVTFSLNGSEAPPGQFPPLAGQTYGFDIGVNDWDPSIADQSIYERQSHVFWTNPGPDYSRNTSGFPTMILRGGGDAGAP